jgi:nucleotide-binding universal stress UspA family protein
MAKRILVPLDGSPAAERIVPLVADLARGSGASLRLLHVAPEPDSMLTRACPAGAPPDRRHHRREGRGEKPMPGGNRNQTRSVHTL